MELQHSCMSDRQRRYRKEYRYRVAGWYHGWLHLMIIAMSGIAAIYIYTSNLVSVQWRDWLALPLGFLSYQLAEYLLHTQTMHRPRKSPMLRALYIRHTLMHHQFFTEQEMRFADHRDWRVTFFPPFTMIVLTLLSLAPSLTAGLIISPNFGWLLMTALTGSYMFYEVVHFCCHVDDNWLIRNLPIINTARRHHQAHHDQALMMEVNMGIGTPIFDWLLGTSDLDRGFFGHLFNGYSSKYLKKNLRRTSRTPKPGNVKIPESRTDAH
ncbi:MAG: fatty acid hydroxylase [Cupriavidus sp.]|jgi:hypothetical protein|uniref:sterol desaturase family protein n=1 Tax=Cupriavidus basilensis TaxID=68895 RepID=UPI000570A1CB|nr:sterol desaturase family protein [Cupriavidus basilensis]MBU64849.1 fatty acid hydroxylase [Cupriavidus sp.]MDF3882823.1 sterol desaturase family protein [Cupriavidus basilensis]